jgi:L-lactate utilization protein LutB
MGLIKKQYDDLRKKVKRSELENQWKAFQETSRRQKANLSVFGDPEKMRAEVKRVRSESVGNWALLDKAVARLEKNQFRVIQAKDAAEAREVFLREIGDERIVVKSKSNLTKEIGLTHFLIDRGIDVVETDIGDRITQISGHRAAHYTGPACHLSRYDIAGILSKHLGREIPATPETLTQAVREDIERYLQKAKVGITGANAITAEEGAILILHNEGNVTRVRTRTKHIALASIDKVYPRVEDAVLMLKMETYLATGGVFPSFIDIVGGRSKTADIEKQLFYGVHDPDSLVLILLDNGRRQILEEKKEYSDLLTCVGCGNCLLACPTYNAVGNLFGTDGMLGGRGVALAALQQGLREGVEDGLFLCTTCGLCGEACPVGIDAGKRMKSLRSAARRTPDVESELEELGQLEKTLAEHGTPYGTMERAAFPSPREKAPLALYIGCVGRTTEAETTGRAIELLKALGAEFTILDEVCCEAVKAEIGSSPAEERIRQNIERIRGAGAEEVLFLCPTCLKTFHESEEAGRSGLRFTPFLAGLLERFEFTSREVDPAVITYHDPCHLGRGLGSFDGARGLLSALGRPVVEMEHHHKESLCCGAGGGVRGFYPKFSRDIARKRVKEAEEVKADLLLTDCLSCRHNLKQGVAFDAALKVMTTPDYLLEGIQAGRIAFRRKL